MDFFLMAVASAASVTVGAAIVVGLREADRRAQTPRIPQQEMDCTNKGEAMKTAQLREEVNCAIRGPIPSPPKKLNPIYGGDNAVRPPFSLPGSNPEVSSDLAKAARLQRRARALAAQPLLAVSEPSLPYHEQNHKPDAFAIGTNRSSCTQAPAKAAPIESVEHTIPSQSSASLNRIRERVLAANEYPKLSRTELAYFRNLITDAQKQLWLLRPVDRQGGYRSEDFSWLTEIDITDPDALAAFFRRRRPRLTTHPNRVVQYFKNLGLELYHFTDHQNADSIVARGLLSDRLIRSQNIKPSYVSSPGSRVSDQRLRLDSYVHLAFSDQPKMYYSVLHRTPNPIEWFKVSPEVLDYPESLYCRGLANQNNATWLPTTTLTTLDILAIYKSCDCTQYWQVMVRDRVTSSAFSRHRLGANSRSQAPLWL